jgi:O-antigen/teichoic acid export membrane protein
MMVWLGAYAFLRPLFDDGIGLLWAVGDTKKTAFIMGGQALLAAVLVPVLWSAYGIQGLCYAMAIVAGAGVCGVAKGVRDYVDLAWRNILFAPFLALVVAALAALAYGHFAPSDWLWPNLVLRGICVTLAYGGILWIAEYRTLLRDWKHLRRIMREGG